ncbi:Twin-arginine translocation pathway signal [Acidovorax sp. HDW3]|uniref:tripartite tricarboxylate transporter substrate-binding protein n=1 Tax=Acidovorax sp. HDW3 TaxID=2714923 RepID=UPI00140BB608|nr:tripartite tricarboxylate transporter substrate-binding protein [Acidovorax sp. HDW3]QIL44571.1 Twin-arginine translocation pathway signal [Acidovorax sp. HDW3]
MHRSRRHLLQALAAWAAAPGWARASGQPLRLLIGYPPGGATYSLGRWLQAGLQQHLARPVLLDVRPGANGMNAVLALKNAVPDGRTLLLSHDHAVSILPLLSPQAGWTPGRELVPVAGIGNFANALVLSADTPAHSWLEYVHWLRREHDGHGVIGVPAAPSAPYFLAQWIGQQAGLEIEIVPYRGGAPLLSDLRSHQIVAGLGALPDFIDSHRAGKIRCIAVQGGPRQAVLPEVPSFSEWGLPTVASLPFYGLYAPPGTPAAALAPLSKALAALLQDSASRTRLQASGLNVDFMLAAQLQAHEKAHRKAWRTIIDLQRA